LCGELGSATNGASCRGGASTNPANVSVMLDQFKVRRDHSKQVVEIVRDAAGKLSDRFHLLALKELLLDQATCFHGMLVVGDISDEDRHPLARGECVNCVPDVCAWTEGFEECRTLF